jgi:hypothetical protein
LRASDSTLRNSVYIVELILTLGMSKILRQGNRALDYLTQNCQPLDSKVAFLIEMIPKISEDLYSQARQDATLTCFSGTTNRVSQIIHGLTGAVSGRKTLIAQCIFDLSLTVYFDEVYAYCSDKEVASLLTDALLYQATGCEAGTATEDQVLHEGTHATRGVHKFAFAKTKMEHIGDVIAWLFGKEIAALQGTPGDIAVIIAVAPVSMMLRVHAKWTIRYFLYGQLPTETEQEQLNQVVAKMQKDARQIFARGG